MAPPRLLLSAHVRDELTQQISRTAAGRPLELVALEDVVDDAAQTVDAAYISRDITGLSTKHTVLAELAGCYRVLRRSSQLAWVHTHSAGADRPIYAELGARGVTVTTSSGANAMVVAQTALAAVLALSRRFPILMAAQQRKQWAPLIAGQLPPDLSGQRVILVGWGPVAQTLQPLLTLLGMRVQVVRHRPEPAGLGIETHRYGDLPQLLPEADWLVLACPLTAVTHQLINAAALSRVPRHAQLVNVARGEVVDEEALIEALRSGRLAGAFLDVFSHEPLPSDSPLWTLPGVMVTPHAAGHLAGNAERWTEAFLQRLSQWLDARRARPGD